MYREMFKLGYLHIICMRNKRKLIGYSVIILSRDHTCSDTLLSNSILLFVSKVHRGRGALNLINRTEQTAKKYGAVYHAWGIKPENDFSLYLRRKGYNKRDTQYIKYIGGT